MINLDSRKLKNINKPARYIGGEVNQVVKNDNIKSRIVLCYPNLYEKAMSNYIVNLLYNNINAIEDIWCKRCFAPDLDFENLLRENNCNLYSLEDFKSIKESDIVLFVIDNELNFTNFINMLELGSIDINKNNRTKDAPKVLIFALGGVNIKPITPYADYVFDYNDEKENVQRLLRFLNNYINVNCNPEVSSFDMHETTNNYQYVDIKHIENSIVPSIKINNSSIIIDFNYMVDIENIVSYIEKCIKARGINKVAFLGQDKIDCYKFCEIVYKIKANIEDIRIISKNIDFNKFPSDVLDVILPCIEPSTINFNVITCSDKLKNKIGLGTDREEILEKINKVFKNNRNSIKLSFNIGLPEETYEDIDNIFDMSQEIVDMYSKAKAKDKFSMKINLNYYIPTELDKVKYNITKLETKLRYIKEKKYDAVIKLDIEDIESYITKVLLKNGDESVYKVISYAYKLGARFDGDNKKYNKDVWEKALFDNIEITNKYLNSL